MSLDEDHVRELLDFYGPIGLDWAGIESMIRLAGAVETCDIPYVAVTKADLRRLLTWIDRTAGSRQPQAGR